jgi:hypothetical protein
VLFDLDDDSSVHVITYDGGFAQSVYVFVDVYYWVNYDPSTGRFFILCTSRVTEVTTDLGLWYDSEICIVVDRLYIYVLDKENNRIDVYSKRTLKKEGGIPIIPDVHDVILGFGE